MQIGVLGTGLAATIFVREAKQTPIHAVASRNRQKAFQFAKKHDILKFYDSYQALLDNPEIDLVYISLPNALHAEWTIRALESGKHVLCEKPLAANASEVERIQKAAEKTGLYVAEAMHYRYHPLTLRLKQIIDQGTLGPIQSISADLCLYLFRKNNIRFSYSLAGGTLLDTGCYPLDLIRYLIGEEPQVLSAAAHLMKEEIDEQMHAELLFPNNISGSISCSLRAMPWKWRSQLKITAEHGILHVLNPFSPHFPHLIITKTPSSTKLEWMRKSQSSYAHQLQSVVTAVNNKELTNLSFSLGNMQAIDAIYQAAGLRIRGVL